MPLSQISEPGFVTPPRRISPETLKEYFSPASDGQGMARMPPVIYPSVTNHPLQNSPATKLMIHNLRKQGDVLLSEFLSKEQMRFNQAMLFTYTPAMQIELQKVSFDFLEEETALAKVRKAKVEELTGKTLVELQLLNQEIRSKVEQLEKEPSAVDPLLVDLVSLTDEMKGYIHKIIDYKGSGHVPLSELLKHPQPYPQ